MRITEYGGVWQAMVWILSHIYREENHMWLCWQNHMYMLSGIELIDTGNMSLSNRNMKFVGEWTKQTSHKLHILSHELIFFSINHIHILRTCLSSLNQTLKRIYGTSICFDICIVTGKMIQNIHPHSLL